MGGKYVDQDKRRATWRKYHAKKKDKLNAELRAKYEENVFPKHLQNREKNYK